jgi:hypothetical protein
MVTILKVLLRQRIAGADDTNVAWRTKRGESAGMAAALAALPQLAIWPSIAARA